MWSVIKNTNYFINFCEEFDLSVTDYVSIYNVNCCKKTFTTLVKNSNPKLEINENVLIELVLAMINNPSSITHSEIFISNNELNLDLTKKTNKGFPVKLKLNMKKGSDKLFYQRVTIPLLKAIKELKDSQANLMESLVKKDRGYYKTLRFNEEQHYKDYGSFSNVCNHAINELLTQNEDEKHDTNVIEIKDEILSQNEVQGCPEINIKQETLLSSKTSNDITVKQELENFNASPKKKKKFLNL